ncbi:MULTISPECIES: nucleotide exchange factor GrpE [unclassified Lebetimonas]|uniref:nucleotide exchange factor GrpE n=1 Tax=unclassified Lebetimonas TaxID=2648158 RepID=UPI0004BA1182|nr:MULTISPECIES: nucleotide exchange factor GrpE [unclassified Lebetimonas]
MNKNEKLKMENEKNNQKNQEQNEKQQIDVEALRKENEELKQKLDEALRAYAKCENDKKIIKKETDALIEYAYEKFAKDLLPVVDSLELAIVHAGDIENKEEAFDKLLEGVELTLKKMLDTFKNHGIEPVEHDEFNPEIHQAIQHVQSEEHEDGAIVDIYQKGYKLKDRLIRPSMVTINKKS